MHGKTKEIVPPLSPVLHASSLLSAVGYTNNLKNSAKAPIVKKDVENFLKNVCGARTFWMEFKVRISKNFSDSCKIVHNCVSL